MGKIYAMVAAALLLFSLASPVLAQSGEESGLSIAQQEKDWAELAKRRPQTRASHGSSGTYEKRAGIILVTKNNDSMSNMQLVFHAAIMFSKDKIVHVVGDGVLYAPNDWNNTKSTCYAAGLYAAGAGDIAVFGDTLYGVTDHVDESSHVRPLLYEIDAGTMKLKRKTDLGKFDYSVGLTATKDGLYFVTCNAYEQKVTISKGIPSYGLHFYAKATGQVESYRLSNGFPRSVEPWGDLLVIAHGDADEGKTITWFDTKTKREVGHVTLEHNIFHMHVQGDSLYVMDYSYDSEGAHSNMYRYTMAKDGTAALQAKGSVYQHGKSSSHINSFFVNEPT